MAAGTGRDLRLYSAFSFRKGIDIRSSPLDLVTQNPIDTVRMAKNAVMTANGGMKRRYDAAAKNTTTLGAAVRITGGIHYRKSDGTKKVVVGTNDGRLVEIQAGGATANIKTGLTSGTRWSFAVYNDLLIAANGADPPRKWDGTTEAALGGTPPTTAKFVAVHGNRVFFTETTAPSKLTWSALNNEENYTAANNAGSVFVMANDGSDLLSLVPGVSEMLLVKGAGVYRLQGTSPSTFAETNIVRSPAAIGGISPFGAIYAANQIYWINRQGVLSLAQTQAFGDLREADLSTPINPYFLQNTGVTLSLANLDQACGVYDYQHGRLMWAVDTDADGKNDIILVYDLLAKGWTTWTNISAASLFLVRDSTTGEEEVWAGSYDGFVYALNRTTGTNTYSMEVRHLTHLGLPGVVKSPRHMFLYFDPKGATTATLVTIFDLSISGGQTYSVSLATASKTLGVDWVLGTDALGAPTHVIKRVDLSGLGEFVEFQISNAQAGAFPILLGYQVFFRPRRVVRGN